MVGDSVAETQSSDCGFFPCGSRGFSGVTSHVLTVWTILVIKKQKREALDMD